MPTNKQIAGAAAALIAIMAGLIGGYRYLTQHSPTHVSVDWDADAGIPPDAVCLTCNVRGEPSAFAFFNLSMPDLLSDGGCAHPWQCYAVATICAAPSEESAPSLPDGIYGLDETCTVAPYDAGPQLEIWSDTEDAPAPFRCACAKGPDCAWRQRDPGDGGGWQTAPRGLTMNSGTWDGGDCRPKSCVEHFGFRSIPASCDAWAVDGGVMP